MVNQPMEREQWERELANSKSQFNWGILVLIIVASSLFVFLASNNQPPKEDCSVLVNQSLAVQSKEFEIASRAQLASMIQTVTEKERAVNATEYLSGMLTMCVNSLNYSYNTMCTKPVDNKSLYVTMACGYGNVTWIRAN